MAMNPSIALQTEHLRIDKIVQLRRVCAGLIDLALLSLIQFWINGLFGFVRAARTTSLAFYGDGLTYSAFPVPTVSVFWLLFIVVAYFFVQEAFFSTTVGKMILGLRVVDRYGRSLSVLSALIRNMLRLIDSWPGYYLVGIVIACFSPTYQRLGDRVAQTYVVSIKSVTFPYIPVVYFWRLAVVVMMAILLLAGSWGFAYYNQPSLAIQDWQTLNNTWTFNPQTPQPACGKSDKLDSDYVIGTHIESYRTGTPQWSNGSVIYPLSYRVAGNEQLCNGSITLKWQGLFQGGWRVSDVKTP